MPTTYDIVNDSLAAGSQIKQNARKDELWKNEAPARELQKRTNELALDVDKASDSVYGGRMDRARELARRAKYVTELDIKTKESQNVYRNAQASKMSATAFDDSYGLYSLGGKSSYLPKMSEASGGSGKPNPDGSWSIGPSTYKPVSNQADLTTAQRDQKTKLEAKWQDMIDSGEMEVVDTEEGKKYKIRESGQMFNPELGFIKKDGSYASVLDMGMVMGTSKRKSEYLKQTQPKLYKGLDETASSMASPILEKYGLRVTSGFRSPEHNKAVGGAKHSKHMEGHAMDVHWKGKSVQEKAQIIADFKAQGFTGFGVGNNTLHIDRRAKGASWSYIGGTSTGGGKMPGWAAEAINGAPAEPTKQTPTPVISPEQADKTASSSKTSAPSNPGMWTGKPMDKQTFTEAANKTLAILNSAVDKKAATSEQKEFGVLLTTDPEWAQKNGIATVEQFQQYKDVVKERNKEFVKDQKADSAMQRVANFEDYINTGDISMTDKAKKLTSTNTLDIKRLEKDAKDSGSYNKESLKATRTAVKGVQQSAPAMLDIAKLYSDPNIQVAYASAWETAKQKFGEYKPSEDPKKRMSDILTTMAKSAKGRATAILLKTMSGTAASDDEYARTLSYTFGKEGADRVTTLATIQQGLKTQQKEMEGYIKSSVSDGGYSLARDASKIYTSVGQMISDPAFADVQAAIENGQSAGQPKASPEVEARQQRRAQLEALQKRAKAAGRTMTEQAKVEGFK